MEIQYTPAAQIIISIIPIVGIVFFAALMFFVLLWHHREVSLRIRSGTEQPKKFNLKTYALLAGLCLTAVGLALTGLFVLMSHVDWSLLGGLIPLSLGIALIIFYRVNPDFKNGKNEE